MQCPCGGETGDSQHVVSTLAKAKEWDDTVTSSELPITVFPNKCKACGRLYIKIKKQKES